jgi:hypothetical protein
VRIFQRIRLALRRARAGIVTVALSYLLGVAAGGVLAHAGSGLALGYRDKIVGAAQSSPILVSLRQGSHAKAAMLDALGNLGGGIASTLSGYGVVSTWGVAIFRGWVGGVVSVDGQHHSRLAHPSEAFYYLLTLLLQLIPYTLAGGAGVNMGLNAVGTYFGYKSPYEGRRWLMIPHGALADAAWIYVLVVPLFFAASAFEFFLA